ncbi:MULTISPECIES: hypothetical protein [unclassified Streptomyces]|uniref:hypothetical protein n=1 Tax=unclassified Streptomyces TaxID=2593676 RepID=UPI002DDAA9CF|nr:hypothetical protein [Streptomyces sp. NBC_00243]WRZ21887.1 hypothetical protein OHT59_27075 [Streptomyces sp. NBC_00243]
MAQPSPLAPLTPPLRPPGADTPPTCEVPHFAPVRVRGGRYQLRRLTRHKRRAVAAGLAVTAAALIAAGPRDAERARGHPADTAHSSSASASAPVRQRRAAEMVTAPVRIADAATVRLLRRGDRVDVVAADNGGEARVVAAGVRVTEVPEVDATETGALVVLSVPRTTATRLAGASANSRLAVTLC